MRVEPQAALSKHRREALDPVVPLGLGPQTSSKSREIKRASWDRGALILSKSKRVLCMLYSILYGLQGNGLTNSYSEPYSTYFVAKEGDLQLIIPSDSEGSVGMRGLNPKFSKLVRMLRLDWCAEAKQGLGFLGFRVYREIKPQALKFQ